MRKPNYFIAVAAGAIGLSMLAGAAALGAPAPLPPGPAGDRALSPEAVFAYEKRVQQQAKAWNAIPASKDPRDLQGVWHPYPVPPDPADTGVNGVRNWRPASNTGLSRDAAAEFLPLTALGLATRNRRLAATAAGKPEQDTAADCKPFGVPRVLITGQTFQISYAPDTIVVLVSDQFNRRLIHMDGKAAPADEPLTYMGYSRGWWDGNTLIIETDHLRADTTLESESLSHGPKLTVREEITKFGDRYGGTGLRDLVIMTDPDYFTRPLIAERLFTWDGAAYLEEFSCEENSRNAGAGQIVGGTVVNDEK